MRAVRIVGAPASGKSTVRLALAEALQIQSSSIDAERLRVMRPGDRWPDNDVLAWAALRSLLEAGPCIIETSGRSMRDGWLYADVETYTILCVADPDLRRARLIERARTGYPFSWLPNYVARLAAEGSPAVAPDIVWSGNSPAPIAPLQVAVEDWLGAKVA